METLKNFFGCYFNQSFYFDDLDKILQNLKGPEKNNYLLRLIIELNQVVQSKSYALASRINDKYGGRTLNLAETVQLVKYIYNKLTDQPAYLDMKDFVKDCKVVFCPVCCSDPRPKVINLIEKATITSTGQQIYICKPCKLVWLNEKDIRADNAQDYRKFMKSLGFKGLWKELSDVDTL